MIFTIAIDGPAASGKGTIARALAARYGFAHLDTGGLYRAVGAKIAAQGGDPADAAMAEQTARALRPADLERDDLRTRAAGEAASVVAAQPGVRAALVAFQRLFARRDGGAVLDGRDIGTAISPEAEVKLFVEAAPETRAARRAAELGADPAEILVDLARRDARDRARADAPMKAAADAVLIDTTALSIEAAVAMAVNVVDERIARVRAQGV